MDARPPWWPFRPRRNESGGEPLDRHERGRRAEALALTHLERAGLRRLATNARAGRGEIDLIVRDGDTLVFVEVRARTGGALVSAMESLSARKCAKVRETAERLIAQRPEWQALYCRFDVVAVTLVVDRAPEIEWLPNAF
ncbi:MAG: YraN family protein [Halothiobacillaceae bacterium]|nr:YraN family protein [Halothiobacillaceae bacterium]HER34834.1 YraN family protein [Halothiobacillaceae bacterium]